MSKTTNPQQHQPSLTRTEIFNLCDDLIEGRIPLAGINDALRNITPGNLRDIAEERALQGRCGFILCVKPPRKIKLDPQATVLHRGQLIPRDHFFEFCSGDCFDAFLTVLGNLNQLPPPKPIPTKEASAKINNNDNIKPIVIRETVPMKTVSSNVKLTTPTVPKQEVKSSNSSSNSVTVNTNNKTTKESTSSKQQQQQQQPLIKPIKERETPALKKKSTPNQDQLITTIQPLPNHPIIPTTTTTTTTIIEDGDHNTTSTDDNDDNIMMDEMFSMLDLSWKGKMIEEVSPYEVIWDLMTRWITTETHQVFQALLQDVILPPVIITEQQQQPKSTELSQINFIDPYIADRKRQVDYWITQTCATLIKDNDEHRIKILTKIKRLCASLDFDRPIPELSVAHWHLFVFVILQALNDEFVLSTSMEDFLPLPRSRITSAQLMELKKLWVM
jgi:hypothetical protein